MGVSKDRLSIAGRPILLHLLELLQFEGPTLLVASPLQPRPRGAEAFDRIAHDEEVGAGPLAGISAALAAVTTDAICIVSIDMPQIGPEQVTWLQRSATARPDAAGILLRRQDAGVTKIEPFPCYLRKTAAPLIADHFAAGGRSVRSLLDLPGIEPIDVPVSWPTSVWLNLNFPEDLDQIGGEIT
jgi:molybdopterin-guanine dinucleotide biosynthesis protein A